MTEAKTSPTALTYLADVAARLAALPEACSAALHEAATLATEAVAGGGLLYLFGSGHSHMLAEEAHYRAGGIAATVPMLASSAMLHEGAVASTQMERTTGVAEAILARYAVANGDVVIVASNSGVNALPIEMAQACKGRGARIVAITSVTYSKAAANGRTTLAEIADVVLDNGAPAGDAVISVEGSALRVGPVSTVIGVALLDAMLAEVAARLAQRGDAPIYLSANMPGAADVNAELVARYRSRNPHL